MTYRREITNRLAFMEQQMPRWAAGAAILTALVLWELISRSGLISELYLPAPTVIIRTGWDMIISGELLDNSQASLSRILLGFLLGSSLGILMGLATGFSKLAEAVGIPLIYAVYPIPKIALLPLIILWLGIGELSKVTIISLGVFFPVVINTYSGVKNVDPLLIKVAISFKATRSHIIAKVILPAALPAIFAGLKMAAGTSLLLLVAAEMIAAKEGIGALILRYGDLMLTTKLMVGVLTLSLLGVIFNSSLEWIERRIITWKN
ncbi:binding-protein-dependent transport systems inner membrane component [Thermosinus carboxydivorans Nor1]|uniref:Binding-protein-dependent transport systems inner membrane component n=1 Tax=Thermosinus carboxydivorans Nor1 TaxID=401526 RepID=A1HS56_9FIRM|nr:ABC transporter permease [Thermosinus carboxydivorans]EAX47121.1 binding-protein-dependent transport systems inner membrane component [Thermosinus carboxydivorans Nor1]